MVEEKFKLGLELDTDISSLEALGKKIAKSIAREVEAEVSSALQRSLKQAGKLASSTKPAALAGGAATAQSVKQALSVKGSDFPKAISKAVDASLAGFEDSIQDVTNSVNKLNKVISQASRDVPATSASSSDVNERRAASRSAGKQRLNVEVEEQRKYVAELTKKNIEKPSAELARQLEDAQAWLKHLLSGFNKLRTADLEYANKIEEAATAASKHTDLVEKAYKRLANAIDEEAAAHLAAAKKTRSTTGPTTAGAAKTAAEKQVGPSNVRAGANIDATHAAGSQRVEGGASSQRISAMAHSSRVRDGRVGTVEDKPQFHRNQEKSLEARERVSNIQKGAEIRVAEVNKGLAELRKAITSMAGFKGMDTSDLLRKINLPAKAEVGAGASPIIQEFSGQLKVVGGVVEMFGDKVDKVSTIVNERIQKLMQPGGNLEEIQRTAMRDPERAIGRLRKEIAGVLELPSLEREGKPRKGFMAGGQFMLKYTPTEEEKDRISAMKNEAEVIGEVNKIIYANISANEDLRKKLAAIGVEVMTSVGLPETKAADIRIHRDEPEEGKRGPGRVHQIEMPVQTRNLATAGLGGGGGLARWAREFLVTQMGQVHGGGAPTVQGYLEKELHEAGLILKEGFKEFKTVLADPDLIPELREDQFLHDPKVVNMDMNEIKSMVVKTVAAGVQPGAELKRGQIVGTRGTGEDTEQVPFEMTGAKAVVDRLETVFIDGVEGVRVVYKELNETVSGMKLLTRSGVKGMSRGADLERMGFEAGTGIVMSLEGLVKRHGLRDVVEMMAHGIADASGKSAQEIADAIVCALEEGGKNLKTAVKDVAKQFGVEAFSGTMKIGGPLGKAAGGNLEMLTGKLAWARAPREGMTGPMKTKERFIDPAAMKALSSRAETAGFAEQWRQNIKKATDEHKDLIMALRALRGEVDITTTDLKRIRPEDLKRLPSSGASTADLKGTLLDPEMKEAMAMMLPARGGGERAMYVPSMGSKLGQRGGFPTDVGTKTANDITVLMDRIAEQATKVKGAMGQLPLEAGSDQMKEAVEITSKAMRTLISEIVQLSTTSVIGGKKVRTLTEEGEQQAKKFIEAFMPLIKSLGTGSVGLKFRTSSGKEEPIKRSAEDYVKFLDEKMQKPRGLEQQLYSIQDVLAQRSGKGTNVEQLGRMHTDVDILNKSMEILGVTLEADGAAAEKAISYLEKLEAQLFEKMITMGSTRAKPGKEERRSIAAAAEGGVSLAPMGTVLQFRTDVNHELAEVSKYLEQMAAAGQDVGEAAAAYQRISAAQDVGMPAIPRDVVLINKQDFSRLVKLFSEKLDITPDEARMRLSRTGLAHRYPTTGEQSFMPARLKPVGDEVLPRGKFGLSGTMAVSSTEDLSKMLAPLQKLEESLLKTASENNFSGEEAEKAGQRLRELSPVLDKLRMQFISSALNLDFDGDKIAFHADMAEKASEGLKTFSQQVDMGMVGFRKSLTSVLSKTSSIGGPGTNLDLIETLFQSGKAKGRPEELKSAVPWGGSPEKAQFEAIAHTAPKKSVGLLTDMFNRMYLAVQAGDHKMSEAMNTAMGHILLGMNEALAQKHGGKGMGEGGPMEFLDMVRKGQMNEIFSAMDAGQGFFGKLAKQSQIMMDEVEKDLKRLAATKGAEGLSKYIEKAGIVADIDPTDLNKSIANILKASNMKESIRKMFEILKENAISAAMDGGATLKEAQESIADALNPHEKTGFVRGLDLNKMLQTSTPGYAMTRSKGQAALKELEPQQRAGEVLKLVSKTAAEEVGEFSEGLDPANVMDPRAIAGKIRSRIKEWMKSVIGGSFGDVQLVSPEAMAAATGSTNVRARFVRGTSQTGAEGAIEVRRDLMNPIGEALKNLGKIARGELSDIDISSLTKMNHELEQFFGLIAHEAVHKANKDWAESVNAVTQSLLTGSGELGKYRTKIGGAFEKLHNVKSARQDIENLTSYKQAGATTGSVFVRERNEAGEYQHVSKSMPIDDAIQKAKEEYARKIAEELMAYRVQPGKWEQLGLDKLPAEVGEFVDRELDRLKQHSGAGGDLLRKATDALSEFTESTLSDLMRATQGLGPDVVKSMGGKLPEMPDAGRMNKAIEVLNAHERVILESGSRFTRLSRIGQGEGGRLMRQEPVRKVSMSESDLGLGRISEAIQKIHEEIPDAIGDPDMLRDLQSKLSKQASAARTRISSMSKDPMLSGKMGGLSGQEEYMNSQREFQRDVAMTMAARARELQDDITTMREAGREQTPEFGTIVNEFINTVKKLSDYASSTLSVRGKGKGHVASYLAGEKGELLPSAREAGVSPTNETFQAIMHSAAGTGEEAADFLDRMKPSIEGVIPLLANGADSLEMWSSLFQHMLQYPETFKEDMGKVVEIFSKFSTLLGGTEGPFSKLVGQLTEIVSNAKEVGKAVKNVRIKGPGDIMAATGGGGGKRSQQALARGLGGTFEDSINEQFKQMEAQMEERRQKLEKMIQTPGYRASGAAGRHFEGETIPIIDPESGTVMQKFATEFVRHGNNVKATLRQIGAESKSMGATLQVAFRRVVQWGFATGIIYGALRAFRAFTDTVVNVQTKITELKKVMDTTVTNFEAMQNAASDMAMTTGIAIEDVLDGMTAYAQQGLTMNETLERTRSTLMAVNVTTLSSAEATEALTSVMKIFDDELGSSESAVDAWAMVAAKHAVTAKDLALAVQRTGSAAKEAGLSFNQFLGITTAIGSVTRQSGKEVATGEKFMFRSLRTPKTQKELLGVGVKSQTATGELRPIGDVLGELAGKWDNLSRSQKLNIAQAAAGSRHYNQFLVLMQNWQEAVDAAADAENSQGFAARKEAIAVETMGKQMQTLRETLKRFALDLGKSVLPAMQGIVTIAHKMLSVFNMLPDTFKAVGIGGIAAFAGLTRAASFALDTFEAFVGVGTTKDIKEKGLFKSIGSGLTSGVSSVAGAFSSPFKGMSKVGKLPEAAGEGASILSAGGQEIGVLATGLDKVVKAAGAATEGMSGLSVATSLLLNPVTGVIALIAALGTLAYVYLKANKTGKEVEDEMYDQIGQMQDQITKLQSQDSMIRKVSTAWNRYEAAVKTAADPAKLQEAISAGDFTGPLVALKSYKDTLADVGLAMASLDPSSLEGISESGDYIVNASDAMKSLNASAVDAKKATLAAMDIKVIKAYSDELSKATTSWEKFIELVTGGSVKMDLLSQLGDARQDVNELAKSIKDEAASGIMSTLVAQSKLTDSVQKELELRQQTALVAQNLKKQLEGLPTFGDEGLAFNVLQNKDLQQATTVAAKGGAYGREATAGSIQMHLMAKNLGLGGLVGGESAVNPERFMQELVGKGMHFQAGAAPTPGALGLISKETAKKFDIADASRVVMTGMDQTTHELVFYFRDAADQTLKAVKQSDLGDNMKAAIGDMLTVDRSQIEEAADKTKKLLTIQSSGALAGVRMPPGGMPDIGPAQFSDMTTEQRVMAALPDQMQRLAEVEAELSNMSKRYSEDLDAIADSYDESSAASEAAAQNIKENFRAMGEDTKQLIRGLKMEQFDLSVLAHTQSAMAKLQESLEKAGDAARDATIEEETRAELMKHTSGALAGLPVAPQLDLGKTLRELSGQERLQKELGPGFSKTLTRIAGVERRYGAGVDQTIDLRKQLAEFNDMVSDLDEARGNLTKSLEQTVVEKTTGASKGDQYVAEQIKMSGDAQLSEMQRQTPILSRMLDFMQAQARIGAGASPQEVFGDLLKTMNSDKLTGLLGSASDKTLSTFFAQQVGINKRSTPGYAPGMLGTLGRSSYFESSQGALSFSDESRKQLFEEKKAKLMEAYEAKARIESTPEYKSGAPEQQKYMTRYADQDIRAAQDSLMSMDEVANAAKTFGQHLVDLEGKTKQAGEITKNNERHAKLLNDILELRNTVLGKLTSAEKESVAETQRAAEILKVKEGLRIAEAAMNLANSIEGIIQEFEKADMLFYQKSKSDVEGAFARVGQPGFRTQFENKRLEVEQQYGGGMRPMSYEDMQAKAKALSDIEYDEKEARIKEKQDTEVAALHQQQGQAEKIRDTLADSLVGGQFSGTDIESQIKSYMDTLTEELTTSEQANMRGGELYFKGVPGLEDAKKFLAQIQQSAKEQAQKAEKQFQVEIQKEGNVDLLNQSTQQTQYLAKIAENTASQNKLAAPQIGPQGLPAPAMSQAIQSAAASAGTIQPVPPFQAITQDDFDQAKAAGTFYGGPSTASPVVSNKSIADLYNSPSSLLYMAGKSNPEMNSQLSSVTDAWSADAADYRDMVMADYKSRGQTPTVIRPTGDLIPEDVKKGAGPINLTDYYNGASNYNQLARWGARSQTGNSTAEGGITTPVSITKASGDRSAPGASLSGDNKPTGQSPIEAQSEILQKLLDASAQTNELLKTLSTTGLQLPPDFGTSISDLGDTISSALGETLSVEVTNSPLEVSVPGIADALSGAIRDSGLSSVGASVSDALGRLSLLESVVDPQGKSVDELIADATSELSQSIDDVNNSVVSDEKRLDDLEGKFDSLPDVESFSARLTQTEGQVSNFDPRITSLETGQVDTKQRLTNLESANTELKDSMSKLSDDLVKVETDVTGALSSISDFGEKIDGFDTRISTAEDAAVAASTAVQDLTDSLNKLQTLVDQNNQSSETSDRDQDSKIAAAAQQISSIQDTIRKLQSTTQSALNIAQAASNRSFQR